MKLGRESLPAGAFRVLRACRAAALYALEPLDWAARALNGRRDFPPLRLRRYVGPLRSFEMSGAEFMSYCRLLLELRPDERVLDVGCGCGLMALHLRDYLDAHGRYTGLDIHAPSIEWCRRHVSASRPNFEFERIDVRSDAYNPGGRHAPEAYVFPFADGGFDAVLLKSVFTHLRPGAIENYLKEVACLLSPGGRALATFFLLNERQEALRREGLNRIDFRHGEGVWRHAYRESPESAVAYSEDFVLDLLDRCGLALRRPVLHGSWSGYREGLSFQDMLLLERARTPPEAP
ncbi:MAG TPA: methyltransferase domain-containing protein [Pyrinomonadaceae bacterium]